MTGDQGYTENTEDSGDKDKTGYTWNTWDTGNLGEVWNAEDISIIDIKFQKYQIICFKYLSFLIIINYFWLKKIYIFGLSEYKKIYLAAKKILKNMHHYKS